MSQGRTRSMSSLDWDFHGLSQRSTGRRKDRHSMYRREILDIGKIDCKLFNNRSTPKTNSVNTIFKQKWEIDQNNSFQRGNLHGILNRIPDYLDATTKLSILWSSWIGRASSSEDSLWRSILFVLGWIHRAVDIEVDEIRIIFFLFLLLLNFYWLCISVI